MYTFSNRLKIASFILMAVGLLGIGIGFVSAPSTVEDAKAMVAQHDDGHGEQASHGEEAAHAVADSHGAEEAHGEEHDSSHDEHLLHQLQNRPWAALYVAAFFFMMISLEGTSILCYTESITSRVVSNII